MSELIIIKVLNVVNIKVMRGNTLILLKDDDKCKTKTNMFYT